jgi:hypothetical protein
MHPVVSAAIWQFSAAADHAERAARLALGKLEPGAAEDVVRML